MTESDTAKKARKLIKSVDDLITTIRKDTATVVQAAKELKAQFKDDGDANDEGKKSV